MNRDLAIADGGWHQALQPASQVPAVAEQNYGDVEDFGRPGEHSHGNVPGIPISPDEYDLPIVPGFQWSEGDRPNLESFLEEAHRNGLTQRQTQNLLRWYADGIVNGEDDDDVGDAPATPDGYALIDGKWSKSDEALLGSFFEFMHAHGASQNAVDGALQFYQSLLANTKAIDANGRHTIEMAIGKHVDVDAAGVLLQSYLSDGRLFPRDFISKVKAARTPDGRKLIHDPDFFAFLFSVAKQRYAGGSPNRYPRSPQDGGHRRHLRRCRDCAATAS
jgi:hypothetical protein